MYKERCYTKYYIWYPDEVKGLWSRKETFSTVWCWNYEEGSFIPLTLGMKNNSLYQHYPLWLDMNDSMKVSYIQERLKAVEFYEKHCLKELQNMPEGLKKKYNAKKMAIISCVEHADEMTFEMIQYIFYSWENLLEGIIGEEKFDKVSDLYFDNV